MTASDDGLKKTAQLIKSGKAKKIAVLTGAGISTSAGIPDFRSPGTGLYDNLAALNLPFPEAVFTLDYFEERPEPFWTLARDLYPGKYYPTPTHYFLALLHRKGVLQRVWSQNIDTLETAAGVPVDLVLEAHGSFATAHCLRCKRNASVEHVIKSGVREGKVVRCMHDKCNGLVKPDIVFFGEGLPNEFFLNKRELFDCDLMIVIGTSLQVHPFAGLVDVVSRSTPRLLINREAVGPFDTGRWRKRSPRDSVYLGDADAAVRLLARELGWEEELDEMIAKGRKELEAKWAQQEKLYGAKGPTEKDEGVGKPVEKETKAKEEKAKGAEADDSSKERTAAAKEEGKEEGKDVDALAEAIGKVELGPKSKV